jgi:tryptophan-rich sensory protein
VSSAKLGRRDAIPLVVFLGVSFVAAAIGSFVTFASLDPWYANLQKPAWTPSGAVIGAIWTVLYALMGIAAWLVWREKGWSLSLPLVLFAVQLVLNVLWSVLFFGLQNLAAGLIGILFLWAAVAATLVSFWRVTRWAGALFVPYLAWVTIATTLNAVLWQMNP